MTEHVLIAVHAREAPSEEEWESYLQAAGGLPATCRKTLVVTAGGSPNAKQRASINDLLRTISLTVAICTDALLVKQIGTALSWFNPRLKAFKSHEIAAALEYLNIDPREAAVIQQKIARMKLEMAGPTRPAR